MQARFRIFRDLSHGEMAGSETMAMVSTIEEVPKEEVTQSFVLGTKIQWLIAKKDGAQNFAMRRFTLAPGGTVGLHTHPWEHEVYILAGQGEVLGEQENLPVGPGSFAFVPGDERHGFQNTSTSEDLIFLCMIPITN